MTIFHLIQKMKLNTSQKLVIMADNASSKIMTDNASSKIKLN